MSQFDSAFAEFFAEGQEIVDRMNMNLILLEGGDLSQGNLDSLYRDMHTLKGTSQLFGFMALGSLTHALESSLDPVRKGDTKLARDPRFHRVLFQGVKLVERILEALAEKSGEEVFSGQIDHILGELTELQIPSPVAAGCTFPADQSATEPSLPETKNIQSKLPENTESKAKEKITMEKPVESDVRRDSTEGTVADSTIRVPVQLLDKLMNLVGELVLVRNQVLQFSQKSEEIELLNLGQNLNMVTTDLQAEVMRTRMQPVGSIVGKFQRVVRDIASQLGKKIEITISGAETEVDKTLLEAVKDPLTHIIRNSCDHGIESPQERQAKGKSESGSIGIKAYHEGGQVVIEVSDDGKGLNYEKISKKAIERGLFSREQLDRMSERELAGVIFLPGFSTADQVSAVSGRGVGMDVVKTNIEKIGGAIDVVSSPDKGMTISLRIPLTLAIVPAMIIRNGNEKFAIPQVKLVELVRVEKDSESGQQIEFLHGKPMLRLRGHLLPLIHLMEVLGDLEHTHTEETIESSDSNNIVVLHSDGISFGLIVDDILDTGDIVVKPVGHFIKALEAFSGATIMGDGSVALILDVGGIARKAVSEGDLRNENSRMSDWLNSDENGKKINSDAQDFLLFETSAKGRYALPLCLVHRLEEFSRERVEYSGEQRVIRYRNSILPLISISKVLSLPEVDNGGQLSVIVVQKNGRSFGIEVKTILDVVSIDGSIDENIRDRKGVMGSTIHQDEVIVIVDILNIIDAEARRLGFTVDPAPQISARKNLRILLAEDTPFFRKQIAKVLERSGHTVTAATDGAEALGILKEKPRSFDLIVSDIEMPNMTGLELARAVRSDGNLQKIPMIAVTSRFKEKDREDGEKAGFDRYLEKLNEEILLGQIKELIA